MEIHQQGGSVTAEAQIGQGLGAVDGEEALDRFDFHNKLLGDEHIDTILAIQVDSLVNNGDWDLTFEANMGLGELEAQAFLINRFEKPRPKVPMYFDCQANDLRG